MEAKKYIRIDSDFFQNRLSSLFSAFEEFEHKLLFGVVETYEPLEIKEEKASYNRQSFHSYMRKRELSRSEKEMIQTYLLSNTITILP